MVENEKVQEEVLRTGKVDTIVSEPIGVMLLHERMVSSAVVDFVIILVVGGSKTWS
jgi:histone-arginine methyltransferase CARM1